MSNLALMMVLNLIVKPVAIFGIDAAVQNRVGSSEYGIYFSLLNFSMLFNILLDLGINNFTTKHIAQYPVLASKYLGKILSVRLILFLFYIIFSYSIALTLGWNNYQLYLLGILLFNQFLVTMIAFARSHFGGFMLFKTDAVISVLDRLLLIVFGGIWLFIPNSFGEMTIEWFIWIQTLTYLITVILSFLLLYKRIKRPKITYEKGFTRLILRQSLPYALLILLMMVYTRTDSVMIERIHENGATEAGYYAQGFRLVNALFMFAMLFSNLLFPIYSHMFSKGLDIKPLFNSSTKLLIGGSIFIGLLGLFNSEFLAGMIYCQDIEASSPSFRWIMLSFIGMAATILFSTLLTTRGDLKFLNILAVGGILVNLVMNFFLIPNYGAEGAAFATLITQSSVAFFQLIRCIKVLKLSFNLIEIGRYVVYTTCLVLGLIYFPINSYSTFFLICAGALLLMVLSGLVPVRQLLRILAEKRNN